MPCYVLLLIAIAALLSPTPNVEASSSHPITTLINAKYKRSNQLQVEIIEYLAEERPTWYWDYLEDLNANIGLLAGGTEQQQYEKGLELAKKYLGPQQLSLLKLSLSLGSLTPLIEANQQIANEVEHDCDKAFVQFGEKVVCTAEDVGKYLETVSFDKKKW
jgi:Thioredoxin-like domain